MPQGIKKGYQKNKKNRGLKNGMLFQMNSIPFSV